MNWPGWSPGKVQERYLSCAQEVVRDGVEFSDNPNTTQLVRANELVTQVLGTNSPPIPADDAVIVALIDGHVVGAIACEAKGFPSSAQATAAEILVRYVVVHTASQGHGIGVVLLGLAVATLPQRLPPTIRPGGIFWWGNCPPGDTARFYQRSGFSVQAPGGSLTLPYSNIDWRLPANSQHPCQFWHRG